FAQPRREIAIDLDCRNLPRALDQRIRQRAQSRADLDEIVAGRGIDRGDDARRVMAIGEEMLTEALARRVTLHSVCRVLRKLDRELDGAHEAADISRLRKRSVSREV